MNHTTNYFKILLIYFLELYTRIIETYSFFHRFAKFFHELYFFDLNILIIFYLKCIYSIITREKFSKDPTGNDTRDKNYYYFNFFWIKYYLKKKNKHTVVLQLQVSVNRTHHFLALL